MNFESLLEQLRTAHQADIKILQDEVKSLKSQLDRALQENQKLRQLLPNASLDETTDERMHHVDASVEIVEEHDVGGPIDIHMSPLKPRAAPPSDFVPSLFSASKRRKIDDGSGDIGGLAKPWRSPAAPAKDDDDLTQPDAVSDKITAPSVVVINIDDAESQENESPTRAPASSSTKYSSIKNGAYNHLPSSEKKPTPYAAAKYVTPVRKKEDREKLPGHACEDCAKFYDAVTQGLSPAQRSSFVNQCSRHREIAERPPTPPNFWETAGDFDSPTKPPKL